MARTQTPSSYIQLDIKRLMEEISKDIEGQLGERLQHWSKWVNYSVKRKYGLSEVHSSLAEQTRRDVLTAYQQAGFGRGKGYRYEDPGRTPPKSFKRYSNGAMIRALESSALIKSDSSSIRLFNKQTLDRKAKQWYRLNFGAGDSTRPYVGPRSPMKFLGRSTSLTLNLREYRASKGFFIPKGYFASTKSAVTTGTELKGSRGAFYPARLNPDVSTGNARLFHEARGKLHGFKGRSFLDRSLTGINKNYGDRVGKLMIEWMKAGL